MAAKSASGPAAAHENAAAPLLLSPRPPSPRTLPSGGHLIKSYVQLADQRRTSSRFNNAFKRPGESQDARLEEEHGADEQLANQASNVAAVAGLFLGRQVHRARRTSVAAGLATGATPASPKLANGSLVPAKRRQADGLASVLPMTQPRPPTSVRPVLPPAPGGGNRRARANLAAKLDTIARTSPWMRRKVVFGDEKGLRGMFRSGTMSPRHMNGLRAGKGTAGAASASAAPASGASSSNSAAVNDEKMEKRVMAAFSRIVRLWRERKRQSEKAALNLVNGQGAAARLGPKLQRELDAQSSNVVSILSRRMIREVPALKFFDDEADVALLVPSGARPDAGKDRRRSVVQAKLLPSPPVRNDGNVNVTLETPASPGNQGPQLPVKPARPERGGRAVARPRGVCYTLDEYGCRRIKMQSGVPRAIGSISSASVSSSASTSNQHLNEKLEGLTMEEAMRKSLRRKMARRVKAKRQAIQHLASNFHRSQHDNSLRLRAKLALHQAESDKLFDKRLALLFSDASTAPPHLARKELALARVRVRKAELIEKCQMLLAFGAILRHVENGGELSGNDLTQGELHFLDVFRCIVEADQVLTPLLAEGVRQEFTPSQRERPQVAELFNIFDQHVLGNLPTVENEAVGNTYSPETPSEA